MKEFLLKKMALPTIVLAWAATYYVEVMGYSAKNHRLIQPVFWVMVLLYVINGITDYREWKKEQAQEGEKPSALKNLDREKAVRVVSVVAVMAIYVAVLGLLGFVISTLLFAGVVLFIMGERKWYKLVGIPLVLALFLYVVFRLALSIPLPTGFLGF